jgi:hypothetical protein
VIKGRRKRREIKFLLFGFREVREMKFSIYWWKRKENSFLEVTMSKILSIFSFPSLSSQFRRKILVSQKVRFSPLFPSLPFFSIDNFSIQAKESGLSSFTLFSFQFLSLKTYALFIDWNKKPKIFFMIECFSLVLVISWFGDVVVLHQ